MATLKPCTACGPQKPQPIIPRTRCDPCKLPEPEEQEYCCGEGYIVFDGPCESKIRTRWISEANPDKLQASVTRLISELQNLYTGPVIDPEDPSSLARILALGIFCEHSTVQGSVTADGALTAFTESGVGTTTVPLTTPTGPLQVGASYPLAVTLAYLKSLNGVLEITSLQRLQDNDLLFLTLQMRLWSGPETDPTRTLIAAFNLYGQFYVSQCGNGLCIDWATITPVFYPIQPAILV